MNLSPEFHPALLLKGKDPEYIFCGKDWDRQVPSRCYNEFYKHCKNDEELYSAILKNPKGFKVALIQKWMEEVVLLEKAKAWTEEKILDDQRAEYERLKQKFEK